ncbi:MAG: 2-hydroxyacid dehydrogenase [Pseudomonadota bacterium]
MKIFLIGEAANHRGTLDAALRGKCEIVGLPREAAASAEFDDRISPEDVVVSLKFSRRGLAVPDFRLLHVPGAGLDGIDFDSLPAGCLVCNVFEHEVPIAEFVCCAMLEWEIRMSALRQSFSAASWSDLYRARVQHGELSGKTMALAGYGRIGQAIAKRAHAFDMRVIAIDPFATDTRGHADEIVRPEQLAGVLAQADYVVIACPLNEDTRGMINAERLASMKPDAVLINVSRAEIAVEQDLYDALSGQRIGGAVLDVWYQYPKGGDDQVAPSALPFADLQNVICTPHSSAWTRNLPQRRYRFIANNLERLARNETLLNIVRKPPP